MTKRNGKGIWLRETEKVLKRFDASLEWLLERVQIREDEMDTIRGNQDLEENEKKQVLGAKRTQSIAEVLEEVQVLIDTHFFNELIGT